MLFYRSPRKLMQVLWEDDKGKMARKEEVSACVLCPLSGLLPGGGRDTGHQRLALGEDFWPGFSEDSGGGDLKLSNQERGLARLSLWHHLIKGKEALSSPKAPLRVPVTFPTDQEMLGPIVFYVRIPHLSRCCNYCSHFSLLLCLVALFPVS